ncbi:hypothetical protein [Thermococcus piezophilus]|uniref:Uncharacterized protein n=1 Tax=Thermococcus piezophilus TaxID=1712654 RepID=A0A172WHS6_9EURY|nr:hypothetical protein [Thermococcus piezophilus]ANF23004.1 hypothetical protein A7C91_07340 [Thermococcus piezophilus]
MRKFYLGILLALMVLSAGCISSEGTSTTTPSTTTAPPNLPFTAQDLENAVKSLKSYEYTMTVDSYNGTKLAFQLKTTGAIDFERGIKSTVTVSNGTLKGPVYYKTYYYTTATGYATLTDRNGTVVWEASCYGPGQGPNLTTSILDNVWKVLTLPGVQVENEGDYYIISANLTGGTFEVGTENMDVYRGQLEVKVTKKLIPVEIKQTAYYTRGNEKWVDVITIEIMNVNSANVEPPEGLVQYLKEQGIDLEKLLAQC